MKLEAPSAASRYVKFTSIGDKVRGLFISYEENQPGNFGPENILTLRTKEGEVLVNCKSDLARKLGGNVEKIVGKVLEITYTEDRPIKGRPQPMKVFDVDVSEPKNGAAAPPPKPAPVAATYADDEPF